MFFYLKISCKNKRLLKKFLCFLNKIELLSIFLKPFPKHRKRQFVTVLKSPHVNKTAQEQFEYRIYSKHFLIRSFKPLTFILLLKKLKNLSFPSINIEIKGVFEKDKTKKYALQVISPDNLALKNFCNYKVKLISSAKIFDANFLFCKKYIQLFDLYGEIHLKKKFHF